MAAFEVRTKASRADFVVINGDYNEEVCELAIKLVLDYQLSHDLTIPDAIIAAMSVV